MSQPKLQTKQAANKNTYEGSETISVVMLSQQVPWLREKILENVSHRRARQRRQEQLLGRRRLAAFSN
jgi:hypothetical protein